MRRIRPDIDSVMLRVATEFAFRSTCERAQVGAVLVQDRRIISTGYNGAPPGMPHCLDVGCELTAGYSEGGVSAEMALGCQRTVHAEANAIAWAARNGINTEGAILYCTHSPCRKCAELLASAGIKRLIYTNEYRATPWDLLPDLGIQTKRG